MIFYEISFGLILVFLVAIVVFSIMVAPIVAFICMLVSMMTYWIINFRSKKGGIPSKIISALGIIASFFIAVSLNEKISTIKSFLLMLVIMSVLSLVQIFKTPEKITTILYVICLVISLICPLVWTIGYEMDNTTKVNYQNLDHYECTKIEFYSTDSLSVEKAKNNGKPLNGNIYDIKDDFVLNITEDHIIGTYKEGDLITPNLEENPDTRANTGNSYGKITWYPVITQEGKQGYIPDTGINLVYNNDSEFVKNEEQRFKPTTWYAYLPNSVIRLCEKIYENVPLCNKIYLTNM